MAILTRTTRSRAVERLVQCMGLRGVSAHPLRPSEFIEVMRRHAPSAVLLRMPSGGPPSEFDPLLDLGAEIEAIPWINNVASVMQAHDKFASLEQLQAAGLPTPPTTLVLRDVENNLNTLPGDRFVVKPLRGAAGHGVTVGLPRETACQNARAFADLTGSALVQSCVGEGIDRRMFIIDGSVVASMERRPTGAGRGNVLYGGETRSWSPNDAQRALGIRAAEVLDLEIAGVDIIDGDGQDVILEVNSCPGFTALEACTGIDVAGAISNAVLSKLGVR
ncbi:MAG: ATP-grasp domain-containing protein [Planctomycetota bacterium]|jgi:RimK family alpha-L-glutamate ligase|nr:ATP-grasp domain-containing protein [Planctomycetota bacterium]